MATAQQCLHLDFWAGNLECLFAATSVAMIVELIVVTIVQVSVIQAAVQVVRIRPLELLHLQLEVEKLEPLRTRHNYEGHCPS